MTEPSWRRLELFRKRLERQCGKLLADAVKAGDIGLIRSHRIRIAALRFAFDGSVEAHRQIVAFGFEDDAPLDHGDVQRVVAIVEAPGVQDGAVLGVVNPTAADAKEFVFHVSALVGALEKGAQFGSTATRPVRPRNG